MLLLMERKRDQRLTSGTEKGSFRTEKSPLGVEIGLWGGAGGSSGSPRGSRRGLGVLWEALGKSLRVLGGSLGSPLGILGALGGSLEVLESPWGGPRDPWVGLVGP